MAVIMTNEEAIKELQKTYNMIRSYAIDESKSRLMIALNMAVKALEQESHNQTKADVLTDITNKYRDTLDMVIKAVEQQPILDKIRAEIIENSIEDYEYHGCGTDELIIETSEVLKVIDKYRQEG